MKAKPFSWLLCAVIVFGFAFKASAQDEDMHPGRNFFNKDEEDNRIFFGGLALGMNFTTVNGDTYGGYSKVGLNGGGIVYVKLSKRILSSVQILYSQKGSRGVNSYDNIYTGTTIEKYYLDLNYVEVPLIFHFLLNDKWQIGAGASYAQLLSSREDAYTSTPTYLNASTQQFHKQDFEYVLSATMQFYKGWFVDATYQYSMKSIRDYANVPLAFTTGGDQYNGMFSLRLVKLIK